MAHVVHVNIHSYFVFTGSTAFAALLVSFPVVWAQPHLGQMIRGREGEVKGLAAEGTNGVDTADDDDDSNDDDDGGYENDGGRGGR